MEDTLKHKDDELKSVLEGERSRATATSSEKKEWADLRIVLESKLAEAQSLNNSLQSELDRVRAAQADLEKDFEAQIEEARASASASAAAAAPRGGAA